MAEMAVDMTKAVIVGTVSKVMSAIAEEAELKERVRNDMEFIKGEFQMMQSFLSVADEERVRNSVVMTWVKQVRDLAYDVEDHIEFVAHLDLQEASWWWRLVPSCWAPALAVDQAVDGIKRLKARVEDVSQRNMRYRLIGDSGSRPIPQPNQPADAADAAFGILQGVDEVAWKLQDMRVLTDLITSEFNGRVISVWEAAGDLRTTSIIRKAYTDYKVCRRFQTRAWAKPMHPFNPEEFLSSLLIQLYANSVATETRVGLHVRMKMKAEADTEKGLMNEFMQRLQSCRYLIVIEGLSTLVEWDAISMYLPQGMDGSRIIVSTRHLGIASSCVADMYQVSRLKEFADDRSICVFYNELCQPRKLMESADVTRKVATDWMEKFEIVGREGEMHQLYRLIHPSVRPVNVRHRVISVWGIPGVGKSSLVRTLYYNEMLSKSEEVPFNLYCWVDVPHPFSLAEVHRNSHWHPHLVSTQAIKTAEDDCNTISFIVIDGLRSAEEWDLIKSSSTMPTRCTIIVITDDESVASYCANEEQAVLNIKCLEAGAALGIFLKEATPLPEHERSKGMKVKMRPIAPYEEHRELMAAKCGGLPKVTVDVGRHMAGQSLHRGPSEWNSLSARFMRELETNPSYASVRGLIDWMKFFFRTCPDSLKPYIYYLSVFPVNCNIRHKRLVRRWIAEGYSKDTEGSSAEQNGKKLFFKLVDLSIIQRTSQGRQGMVNGFFREYMLSQPMQDSLVFVLDGRSGLTSQHRERHLAIWSGWDRDVDVYRSIDFSRLRSLTVFGVWRPFFISLGMVLLQVLDLEGAPGMTNHDISVIDFSKVSHLKFLSLRGCKEISGLPLSLFGLKHLQTLDVEGTKITRLPPAMVMLQSLQYFRAGCALPLTEGGCTVGTASDENHTSASVSIRRRTVVSWLPKFGKRRSVHNDGVAIPQGIWKLRALRTLGVVDASAAGGQAVVKDLKRLSKLHKLGVSGINRGNIKLFCSAVSSNNNLRSLSLRLDEHNKDWCRPLGDISPHKSLESLKLYGPLEEFPASWITQLHNVRKLTLQITLLELSDMGVISRLPRLVTLCLFAGKVKDDELRLDGGEEYDQPSTLTYLEVACKCSIHVIFGSMATENLEVLKVHCYSRSKVQISELRRLHAIREVCLKGSCDDTLAEKLLGELAAHPWKPLLKLE